MKNLLSGWPRTVLLKDRKKNVTGVRITANYFTPEGYRRANGFTGFTTFLAAGDMGYLSLQVNTVDFAVAAGIGVILFYFICRKFSHICAP